MTGPNTPEHLDSTRYRRYHKDIYLPANVIQGALAFLPDPGVELGLSPYYLRERERRGLPKHVNMPDDYEIVNVTIVRDTWAVFRVCISFLHWSQRYNLVLVLDGDYEVTVAYRWSRSKVKLLDPTGYETAPESDGGDDDVGT